MAISKVWIITEEDSDSDFCVGPECKVCAEISPQVFAVPSGSPVAVVKDVELCWFTQEIINAVDNCPVRAIKYLDDPDHQIPPRPSIQLPSGFPKPLVTFPVSSTMGPKDPS